MAQGAPLRDWQCPPPIADEARKLGWLDEHCQDGSNWHRSQRSSADQVKALQILSGYEDFNRQLEYRSKVSGNRLKRNIREVVGAMANIRPLWGYHSENKAFQSYANFLNKTSRAMYLAYFYDRSLKEALQWSAATGTGWLRPCYRAAPGSDKAWIQLLSYGAPSVLPSQLPANGDWQEAYAVTLMEEMPIWMAHALFPQFQDRLHPTSSKYWYASEIRRAATENIWKSMWNRVAQRGREGSNLFIPIRYTWIRDLAINTSGMEVQMGTPDTSWAYKVPSFGAEIPCGTDQHGLALYRKATVKDARLYPRRRLIISSESVVLYDDTAFDWHGQLPLIPVTLDAWPWEPNGFSLVHDTYNIQTSIDQIDRGGMDKIAASLDPALKFDQSSVASRDANLFDPMQPRSRLAFDAAQTENPIGTVLGPEFYEIRPEVIAFKKDLEGAMDYVLGINDIVGLAKSRALLAKGDDKEAMDSATGPVVRDMSRGLEKPLSQLGHQLKYLIMQYMTTSELMQYVGPDGIENEVFDYDPSSIIPSHLPGEAPIDENNNPVPSKTPVIQRAMWFADAVKFFIMPHTAHEIMQISHKLGLLQLRQRGIQISSKTIAEAWEVGNFGGPDGATEYDRFYAEQEDQLLHMLRLKEMATQMGVDPAMLGGGTKGQGAGGGRPNSDKKAPSQGVKGDGRPVAKTS